jgi:hypothetical protein
MAEHPLQRPIADALRLEIAPPGKVSRDGVVWWSVGQGLMQAPHLAPASGGHRRGCAGPIRAAP